MSERTLRGRVRSRIISPPAPPAPDILERDFQQVIIDIATVMGWEHHHQLDSRGSDPGWPDLVLAHAAGRRVIFREVKSGRGRLTPEQARWGELLLKSGLDWDIWTPRAWDQILDTLASW